MPDAPADRPADRPARSSAAPVADAPAFSLWLVPNGPPRDALQRVIDQLARAHGGPSFPPHVTLFGSVVRLEAEVVAIVERLAARVPAQELFLDGIDVGETYFQSLFATVRATPALLAARRAAEEAFAPAPAPPYRPHLSLLYGPQPPEVKAQIARALAGVLPASFRAARLEVYQTGPSVGAWRRVLSAECPA